MIKTKRAQLYLFALFLFIFAGACKQEKEKEEVKEPNPKTDKITLPDPEALKSSISTALLMTKKDLGFP